MALLIFVMAWTSSSAQGCSDAGVCTAGPIGAVGLSTDSTSTGTGPEQFARLTLSYALGERGVVILQTVPQLDLELSKRLSVQAKIPWISAAGELGNNNGVGDPVISLGYRICASNDQRWDAMIGTRLAVNDANAMENGKTLPMPYQTSLGTNDLLAGITYRRGRWLAALAYQHVLTQGNQNTFSPDEWMDDMRALGYFRSPSSRADDAVLRLQYKVPIQKLLIQPGVLGIYHMQNDLGDKSDPEGSYEIMGSQGLTLNLTVDALYKLNDRWAMLLAYGSPVITRDVRPDGLTRSVVLNFALRYRFGS
jgi:hypothetical protein